MPVVANEVCPSWSCRHPVSPEETLILKNYEGQEIDRTPALYDDRESDCTWGRYPDGSPQWIFQESTPYSLSTGKLCEEVDTDSRRLKFDMDQKVSGSGFVSTRNLMAGLDQKNVKSIEHGSGSYESEEISGYRASFTGSSQTIKLTKSNLSVRYDDTALNVTPTRSVRYASRWTESSQAWGDRNSPYISESIRYAPNIDTDLHLQSKYSYLTAKMGSKFEGIHRIESSLYNFKSSEEYSGSFSVLNDIHENDSSIIESSAMGTGFVNTKREIGNIAETYGEIGHRATIYRPISKRVRTYAKGTGAYQAEELIDTSRISLAKDISLSHSPVNYSYVPNNFMNQSIMWWEGTRSGEGDISFVNTEFSNIKKLDSETAIISTGNVRTSANISGKARLQAAFKNASRPTSGIVYIDDEYVGNFSFNRQISIMPVYNVPHLSVSSQSQIHKPECNMMTYTITIIIDGNLALGPIYLKDTFPSGTGFVGSSLPPFELASRSANWSIPGLGSGSSVTFDLDLQITTRREDYNNRLRAITVYQKTIGKTTRDRKLRASNNSILKANWSDCGPQNILATFTATPNPKNPRIVTFRLTVQNLAEENMSANITASMPPHMMFLNTTWTPLQMDEDRIIWTISKLAPDKRRTVSFMAKAEERGLFTSMANIQCRSIDSKVIASINVGASVILDTLANLSTAYSLDWLPCDEEMLGPKSWEDAMISSGEELECLCQP
jgi:hypothetical protein